MLERESHNILDTIKGHCWRISVQSFCNNDLDSSKVIACIPIILGKKLLMKFRELQNLKFSVLINVYIVGGLVWLFQGRGTACLMV